MPASASMWILGQFLGFSTTPGRITRRRLSLDRRPRVKSEIPGRGPLRRRENFGGGQPVSIKIGSGVEIMQQFRSLYKVQTHTLVFRIRPLLHGYHQFFSTCGNDRKVALQAGKTALFFMDTVPRFYDLEGLWREVAIGTQTIFKKNTKIWKYRLLFTIECRIMLLLSNCTRVIAFLIR